MYTSDAAGYKGQPSQEGDQLAALITVHIRHLSAIYRLGPAWLRRVDFPVCFCAVHAAGCQGKPLDTGGGVFGLPRKSFAMPSPSPWKGDLLYIIDQYLVILHFGNEYCCGFMRGWGVLRLSGTGRKVTFNYQVMPESLIYGR